MRVDNEIIESLRKKKDKDVTALVEWYDFITSDPSYESIVARLVTLNTWNSDLITNPVSILSTQTVASVGEDGINEKAVNKQDKEIDRVLKFLEKQPMLLQGLDEMRKKLSPDENEKVNRDKRIKEGQDRAFKAKTDGV